MDELVLVTGGTGYVCWCIAELLRRGYPVRTTMRDLGKQQAVADAIAGDAAAPDARLEFARADLTDDAGGDAALSGVSYVLHVATPLSAASSDPDALIKPARDGTLRVSGRYAAGVKRVVLTSAANAASPASYAAAGVTDETLWTDPTGPGL